MDKTATQQLLELLENERVCLLHAQFDGLAALAERKQDLLAAVANNETDITEGLLDAARRNGRLFAAAMDGLRAARGRLAAARSAAEGVTYGPDGRLRGQSHASPGQRV